MSRALWALGVVEAKGLRVWGLGFWGFRVWGFGVLGLRV